MLYQAERQKIVDACLAMVEKGLVVGTAGNVSIRVGDHVVISPSAVPYEEMQAGDVAVVEMGGKQIEGNYKPSSECPLHLSVYANTDAAWLRHLALDGDLKTAEPKALRFRLLAVPARLVRHARKRILKLPDDWAWTEDLITAWTRLHALHPH